MKDRIKVKGTITAIVRDDKGNVKREKPGFLRRLFGIPGRLMIYVSHNIVTDQGDALVCDLMSKTPARNKVDGTNGHIEVGTAYSGTGAKAQTGCHTPTGSRQVMDSPYPKQKGSWGAANDNVTQYQATFPVAALNATINEASIHNASTSGDCLAYGHVSPDAVVTSADSLQILWEITYLGA